MPSACTAAGLMTEIPRLCQTCFLENGRSSCLSNIVIACSKCQGIKHNLSCHWGTSNPPSILILDSWVLLLMPCYHHLLYGAMLGCRAGARVPSWGAVLGCHAARVPCWGAMLWCQARVPCWGAMLGCQARGVMLGCHARVPCWGARLGCHARVTLGRQARVPC